MSDVQRWRRKPPVDEHELTAARYAPGKPLDGVNRVAAMVPGGRVAVAYFPNPGQVPSTPVLVAAWTEVGETKSCTEYAIVPPGEYLVYDSRWDSLEAMPEAELTARYEVIA